MHPAEFLVFTSILVIPIFFLPVYSGTQIIAVMFLSNKYYYSRKIWIIIKVYIVNL